MIARLTGTIWERTPEQLILDVQGVGYRVQVPLSTYYALSDEEQASLLIYTHVREDAIQLFGFLTSEERELFTILIGVSGVGCKLAVNILSNMPVEQLCTALYGGDIKGLSGIPGIGKKTAERLVLELRDKVVHLAGKGSAPTARPQAEPGEKLTDDAISALINLGYKEAQARKALSTLAPGPDDSLETMLKQALGLLMK
ncbi:MAG: Holliday junction branch migration protein RuvA [Desulfuromonas sp.]|nr:MAG: Holliday junction branch migration protein RuvA [Desulfuromonas sp.]